MKTCRSQGDKTLPAEWKKVRAGLVKGKNNPLHTPFSTISAHKSSPSFGKQSISFFEVYGLLSQSLVASLPENIIHLEQQLQLQKALRWNLPHHNMLQSNIKAEYPSACGTLQVQILPVLFRHLALGLVAHGG